MLPNCCLFIDIFRYEYNLIILHLNLKRKVNIIVYYPILKYYVRLFTPHPATYRMRDKVSF